MSSYGWNIGDQIQGRSGKNYTVVKIPKSGAIAEVYQLRPVGITVLGQDVILKLNPPDGRDEPQLLGQVAMALTKAKVPMTRIVRVVDNLRTAITNRTTHIESLAVGNTCKDLLPTETQAIRIAIEVAELLRACALQRIAYLDIKPLNHVFWCPDPWSVTVIDWNVAQTDASFMDLRDDLLRFCERLPEFFTGRQQDNSSAALHALSWSPVAQPRVQGQQLSYAVWQTLAQLSLSWAGPFLPEVGELICIPGGLAVEKRRDQKFLLQLIEKAWDAVINSLSALRVELEATASQATISQPSGPDPSDYGWYLLQCLARASHLTTNASSDWHTLLSNAETRSRQLMQSFLSVEAVLRSNSPVQHERPLRIARLLNPQSPQPALALSAYLLWTRSNSNDAENGLWKELVLALASGNERKTSTLLESSWEQLRKSTRALAAKQEPGKGLRCLEEIWDNSLNHFRQEIMAWIYLQQAQAVTQIDVETRLRLVGKVTAAVPDHPLAGPVRQAIEEERAHVARRQQAVESLKRSVRNLDPLVAQTALNELTTMGQQGDSVAARWATRMTAQVRRLENQHSVQLLAGQALASWDSKEIDDFLLRLAEIPQNPALNEVVERIKERSKTLRNYKSAHINFEQKLLEKPSRDPTQILLATESILIEIERDYHDGPLNPELRRKWINRVEQLLAQHNDQATKICEDVKRLISESTKNLDKAHDLLADITARLDELEPLRQNPKLTGAPWTLIDSRRNEIEKLKAEISQKYQEIENEIKKWLSEAITGVSYDTVKARAETLPESLQGEFLRNWAVAFRNASMAQIEAALESRAPDQVDRLIKAIPTEVQDEAFQSKLDGYRHDLEDLRLLLQAKVVLDAKSPDWLARANAMIINLEKLPKLNLDQEEVLSKLRDRRKSTQALEENLKSIEVLLLTPASADLETLVKDLTQAAQALARSELEATNAAEPRLAAIRNTWITRVNVARKQHLTLATQLLDKAPDKDAQIDSYQAELKREQSALQQLSNLPSPPASAADLPDIQSTLDRIEQALETSTARRALLRQEFESRLQESIDPLALAPQLESFSPLIARILYGQMCASWRQKILARITDCLLDADRLDEASEDLKRARTAPPEQHDASFDNQLTQLEAELRYRKFLAQSAPLLERISDDEWLARTKTALSNLDNLPASHDLALIERVREAKNKLLMHRSEVLTKRKATSKLFLLLELETQKAEQAEAVRKLQQQSLSQPVTPAPAGVEGITEPTTAPTNTQVEPVLAHEPASPPPSQNIINQLAQRARLHPIATTLIILIMVLGVVALTMYGPYSNWMQNTKTNTPIPATVITQLTPTPASPVTTPITGSTATSASTPQPSATIGAGTITPTLEINPTGTATSEPTAISTAKGWNVGSQHTISVTNAIVYSDADIKSGIWQYRDSETDAVKESAVTILEEPINIDDKQYVKVQAKFLVVTTAVTINATDVSIANNPYLRPSFNMDARIAFLSQGKISVEPEAVKPYKDDGNYYEVTLTGWIPTSALTP